MAKLARQPWLLGIFSAALLLLPFSIIGPVPYRRTFFAWLAFVPLFYGLLSAQNLRHPKAMVRGTFAAYLMGVLWFAGNCYWIYQTMLYYGGLPPFISAGILIAYSLVLGLYFAAFGLVLTVTARAFRGSYALLAAPFFWVALEVLSARLTKVPWDLLGYSQIDNYSAHQPGSVHRCLRSQLRTGRGQRADCLGPGRHPTPFAPLHQRHVGGAGAAERRSFCAAGSAGAGDCGAVAAKSKRQSRQQLAGRRV